jgi:hypothetical protein
MRLRVTVTEAREITERDQHGDTENTEKPITLRPQRTPRTSEGWR